jgi:hypothetical protein
MPGTDWHFQKMSLKRSGFMPRWIPFIALLFTAAGIIVMFLIGGLIRILAWYLLQLLLPALGFLAMILTIIWLIIQRRADRVVVLTELASLIALSPALIIAVPLPSLFPVGFAEGLPLYFKGIDGPAMPEGGIKVIDGTPVATGTVVQNR